jgi:hypothetical protein
MPNGKNKSEYLDWREITGSGIIDAEQSWELEAMLHKYMAAKEQEKEAREVLGDNKHHKLAKELETKLLELGLPKMSYLGNRFTVRAGQSTSIKKELLIANGVSLEVIEASTTKTPWTTLIME